MATWAHCKTENCRHGRRKRMRKSADSLPVLTLLGEHHEFMESIKNIAIMEDRTGDDSAWWSDYRFDEENKSQYNISVFTEKNTIRNANKRPNIKIFEKDISNTEAKNESFDIIWANSCLQRSVNPFETLRHWWSLLKTDGMLCLSVPQNNYIDDLSRWQIHSYSGEYFNWNMVNLIQSLATCGFDCREGHFKQKQHDLNIWAAVYKSGVSPLDPKTTNWYHLLEKQLTPASIDECIMKLGYVRHEFLKVEWLDHTIYDLAVESIP